MIKSTSSPSFLASKLTKAQKTMKQRQTCHMSRSGMFNSSYDGTRIVSGEPGTGKTILAISFIEQLVSDQRTRDLNVGLVVPMTSLRQTLKRVFSKVQGLKPSLILGPHDVVGKNFDVLIVDETHRLRRRKNLTSFSAFDAKNKALGLAPNATELDWILVSSRSQILFYDPKQTVRPGDIRPQDVIELGAKYYSLTNQLRVNGGDGYIEYVDALINGSLDERKSFDNYEFKYFESFNKLRATIVKHHERDGLSCLVAGYAWDWITKKDKSKGFDFEIEGTPLKWNGTTIDWINSPNAINEIGCIHTVQGYDLNYVGVIFGSEIYFDEQQNKLCVDKNKYQDRNGKSGIESQEELDMYVRNIYKTLMTRGIKGTYVYAVNESVKAYLKKWVTK
jgi:uncharacterized protein